MLIHDKIKKVGVVLPIYDQKPEYVYECIYSMKLQDYNNFELVIVIDGANKSTKQALFNALRKFPKPFKILERSTNKGIAYSLNEGFSCLSNCDYLT
ncbi:hypothetical protein SYNTR_0878 [Candidatus Syntrophocurvum alkaliphilum]|uniref:Glycosyltransferase 2-like domain-containing protein n=1 Tax=Candidatus Syntrophocurvum alkaliphilum TaxID=2293317 RepID=A0A6I6DJ13_9FIRM|nr:glycosyltransferase [Candidatus Syntrophocurvum alkaliphilum]QGT99471.1 hypothetical protein SYNTR_0878 [Candidatus Syntrophocurvum alkaliphilum]